MSIKNVFLRPWFTACSIPGWERPGDKGVFFLWCTVGTQDFPSRVTSEICSFLQMEVTTVELASAALSWINTVFTWKSETRKTTPRTPYLPLPISGLFRFLLWNTHGHEVESWPTSRPSITLMEREFCPPSLGGSWTSAFMLGPLPLLVIVCAEVSPSSFDVCSTQLLHLPLKFIPWSAGTRWPDRAFPDSCVLSDPLVGRLSLGPYTASCMTGSPHGKRERAKLTVAYILSWERNHVWGTVEAVQFPWRKPQSPSPWEESMGTGPWSWVSLSLATPFPC